jgi:ComF family protein
MSNRHGNFLNRCTNIVQSFLPQSCLLCGARARGTLLCPACASDLPPLPPARCPVCASPSAGDTVCGACQRRPPAYARTEAARAFDHPLDALIRHFKYDGVVALSALFAELLADTLAPRQPVDLVLPMPLHPARLAQRGFNQAAEIARRLAPAIGLPWRADVCRRVRDTPPQAGLDLAQRRRNLRGAFVCDVDVSGLRIALLDDVMTSGSSLDELAQTVRRAGAVDVRAWVVARAL